MLVTEAQAEHIAEQWFIGRGGTHDEYLLAQRRLTEEIEHLADRLAHAKDPLEIARLLLAHGKGRVFWSTDFRPVQIPNTPGGFSGKRPYGNLWPPRN